MNLLTPIICQVGAYRKENNDLPDSIEDYVTNKELQKYMHLIRYEKKNREDFHLLISDGFDPAAVYTSNNNRWISRDAPFPFKKQVIKVSC
jgi:hypothetical protein